MRVRESDVAEILQLIAHPPNQRDVAIAGDLPGDFDFWFDGGAVRSITGSMQYRFATGTRASVMVVPLLAVSIEFADGRTVHVWEKE